MDATPINTPAGTTVLSSIRLNGSLVYTTYQGGTTAQRFREYMGKQLIPSLEKDDVVIMDNMRSHHAKIVTELLDKAGISYLYLPPYSPDLNPIEKMWSKMKSFLRKRKVRVAAELPEAVKAALETISTNDCKGWFHASGICANEEDSYSINHILLDEIILFTRFTQLLLFGQQYIKDPFSHIFTASTAICFNLFFCFNRKFFFLFIQIYS